MSYLVFSFRTSQRLDFSKKYQDNMAANMKFIFPVFVTTALLSSLAFAESQNIQKKSVKVTTTLIKQLKAIKPDSSNAYQVEQRLGKPSACLPLPPATEAWICQWKGNMNSSGLSDTINIMFEAGMITDIIGIDQNGQRLALKSPAKNR
jgi:hypothetical protein